MLSLFLLTTGFQINTLRVGSYDPADYSLPATVSGYKVLAVVTSENKACLPVGTRSAVLQASPLGIEDFLNASSPNRIYQDLREFGSDWEFSIVGPNITMEDIQSVNENWNFWAKTSGCVKLRPPHTGSNNTQLPLPPEYTGYALFENIDAGIYTNDNAQSVILTAPSAYGNGQDSYSAFLNNVLTNTAYG